MPYPSPCARLLPGLARATDLGGKDAPSDHILLEETDLEEYFTAVAAMSPDGRGLEQVALYYGLVSYGTALLLAPGVRLTGWCDNVFKARGTFVFLLAGEAQAKDPAVYTT